MAKKMQTTIYNLEEVAVCRSCRDCTRGALAELHGNHKDICEFPKFRGTLLLGSPMARIIKC